MKVPRCDECGEAYRLVCLCACDAKETHQQIIDLQSAVHTWKVSCEKACAENERLKEEIDAAIFELQDKLEPDETLADAIRRLR